MPLPEKTTLFTIGANISIQTLTKGDRNYISRMRSPLESPEELKLPKNQSNFPDTNLFRICLNTDMRQPHLIVGTVDFQNWEVIAFSKLPAGASDREKHKNTLSDILTLFYFNESRKNNNTPINLGLCQKVVPLLSGVAATLPQLLASNPDFSVTEGIPPKPKEKKPSSGAPAPHRPAPKKKSRPRKPRSQSNTTVNVVDYLPPYFRIGVPEREIKKNQDRKDIQKLRREGHLVDVCKISLSEEKNAPHILVSTADEVDWKVWSVNSFGRIGEPEIESLSKAFTSFFCVRSQLNNYRPINLEMKGLPGWLVSEHKRAAALFQSNPRVAVVEHLLNQEAGQKPVQEVADAADGASPSAPLDPIDQAIANVHAKRASAPIHEDANEEPFPGADEKDWNETFETYHQKVERFSSEVTEVDDSTTPEQSIANVQAKIDRTSGFAPSGKKKKSPSDPNRKPDIVVKPTPAIMLARRRLMARGEVQSNDVNFSWNNPDIHRLVLAEVERFEAQKAARSSAKLGAAQSNPVAQPDSPKTEPEVKGL